MKIDVDLAGALRKTATLKAIPKACRKQVQRWGAKAVTLLKREAAGMQKSGKGRKTGQLARAVGMHMASDTLTVGTNVQKQGDVKYALIQDIGGTTHPRVTKRMRSWAWFMYLKTGEEKYMGIALTKKSNLNVHIPASRWFSGTMDMMESLLPGYMDEKVLYEEAAKMSGLGGGGEA